PVSRRALHASPTRRSSDLEDEEVKARYVAKHPYRRWVETHRLVLDELPPAVVPAEHRSDRALRFTLQQVFGYTSEDLKFLIAPIDRKSTRLNSSHVKISYA